MPSFVLHTVRVNTQQTPFLVRSMPLVEAAKLIKATNRISVVAKKLSEYNETIIYTTSAKPYWDQ